MSIFHVTILSLFPEIFPGPLSCSLSGKSLEKQIWSYHVVNIRDFGITRHKVVDDTNYGGGSGLVMRADVLSNALDYALTLFPTKYVYYFSPKGKVINQSAIHDVVQNKQIILICGRFAGIDQRILEHYNITELSLGDFILAGGEIAALALMESCIRLLPGVVKNQESISEDSFGNFGTVHGILEYPLYTKPIDWCGYKVPKILLSGNHALIKEWRTKEAMKITCERRPDLLSNKKTS